MSTGNVPSASELKAKNYNLLMDFDLFGLDDIEGKRSIVYFRGLGCRDLFSNLVSECCEHAGLTRVLLCNQLTGHFGSERSTIQKFVYSKHYFPIYLISKLCSMLSDDRQTYYNEKFNGAVEVVKVGTSKRWIAFPKRLTSELAWLCGVIAADGCIPKEENGRERIVIVDQNRNAILKANGMFEKVFGFEGSIYHKFGRYYILVIDCKTISKFFTTFLGFNYGYKTDIICEPEIIKKSEFRLDFAAGVMSFDGSVELDGSVSLGCTSKRLVEDVYQILNDNHFLVHFSRDDADTFYMRTRCLLNDSDAEKWIGLLGLDTEKGQRLNSLVNGFSGVVSSEKEALDRLLRFSKYTRRRESPLIRVFSILKTEGSVEKQDLQARVGVTHATLYKYLYLLRKANIVSCKEGAFGRGYRNFYKFNNNLSEWRVPTS